LNRFQTFGDHQALPDAKTKPNKKENHWQIG
jgi:hypothetical protein